MNPSNRLGRVAALALSALAFTGCASARISSYIPPGADLTGFRTYDWAAAGRLETGDPRLDNNPFFQEQVQANVEKQLTARGFHKASSGQAELIIQYHAHVTQRIDIAGANREGAACPDCNIYVHDAGTLTIDFLDARTNELVWRGWAEKSFEGTIDDQDRMEEMISWTVAGILEKLPPRL